MIKTQSVFYLAISFCCSSALALAQPSTVGNGSTIVPSAGRLENYGINGLQSGQAEGNFPTRRRRLQGTGIGSSFIGTTSATSESTPATKIVAPAPTRVTAPQFRLPKLDSAFPDINNPALQSFTPALPVAQRSSALNDALSKPTSFHSNTPSLGLETLPSFNNRRSAIDQMQFDSSNSFR